MSQTMLIVISPDDIYLDSYVKGWLEHSISQTPAQHWPQELGRRRVSCCWSILTPVIRTAMLWCWPHNCQHRTGLARESESLQWWSVSTSHPPVLKTLVSSLHHWSSQDSLANSDTQLNYTLLQLETVDESCSHVSFNHQSVTGSDGAGWCRPVSANE